jgi:hypothetical protein
VAFALPERLLLALLGGAPREAVGPLLEATGPGDWREDPVRLVRLGLAPLVYSRLRALGGLGHIPRDLARECATAYVRAGIAAAQRARELGTVLAALAPAGIRPIVLKGMYLALEVYPDPALRPMVDIDVLVPRGDLERVVAILTGPDLGFSFGEPFDVEQVCAEQQHLPGCFKPRLPASRMEFHWHIEDPRFRYAIDLDGRRRRSSHITSAATVPADGRPKRRSQASGRSPGTIGGPAATGRLNGVVSGQPRPP